MFGNSSADEDRRAKFDKQTAEFDAFGAAAKKWGEQPAIVDDSYPQWRFEFEQLLDTFFEKADANGRFAPNSRFGRRMRSTNLLRESMEKFRFYQGEHEKKVKTLQDLGPDWNLRAQDSTAKAEVNKKLADRIESFFKNES